MEDDFLWKITFVGRRLSLEDDLRWKMTFDGRRPSVEDNLQRMITFGGRRPSVEDNLQRILAWCFSALRLFFRLNLNCIAIINYHSQSPFLNLSLLIPSFLLRNPSQLALNKIKATMLILEENSLHLKNTLSV